MVTDLSAEARAEFRQAYEQFRVLIDRQAIDALQPLGDAAIYTASVTVHLLVHQRLHANATLSEAVAELTAHPEDLPRNRRVAEGTLSTNTSAYSRARTRLEVGVTRFVAAELSRQLIATSEPTLGGRRVFPIDGTSVATAPTADLKGAYPPGTNQHGRSHWPVVRMVVAHELGSGCALPPVWGQMYGPDAVGEVELAERLLPEFPPRAILMADRNFGIYAFARAATRSGHDILTRLTDSRFRSMRRSARPEGAGRWRLTWKPTKADRKTHPDWAPDESLEVRLHEVPLDGGRVLRLVTTLDYTGATLAECYRRRLDVETDIRDVKKTLRVDQTRARSASMWEKEMMIACVATNLVTQIRRLAAKRAGIEPRRLSYAGVWSLVKAMLLGPADRSAEQWVAVFDRILRGAAQRKVPHRPGRTYPRTVLTRGKKYPPKRIPKPTAQTT